MKIIITSRHRDIEIAKTRKQITDYSECQNREVRATYPTGDGTLRWKAAMRKEVRIAKRDKTVLKDTDKRDES
jgi:hypothetical protein